MMEGHVKLNIAIALLANKIADIMKKIEENETEELKQELDILLHEREELYKGNEEVIDKITEKYK